MRIKILFVGDKQIIINPLRNMLEPVKEDWEIYYASTSAETFALLKNETVDIIVTDMHLAEYQGILILEKVKTDFPEIIRLVISDVKDRALMLKATQNVHQFLSMPDNAILLKRKLKKFILFRVIFITIKLPG